MSFRILWPAMRWPDGREIESSSVGEHTAEFSERYQDVTQEQWENCDAIVTVNDVPDEYKKKLKKLFILIRTIYSGLILIQK